MAVLSNTTYQAGVIASPISTFARGVSRAFASVAAWNDARNTRNVLDKLTARELEDIGLCRADLRDIGARF